jgi:hypothetical protein
MILSKYNHQSKIGDQGSERQVSKEKSRFDKIGFKLYAKPMYFSSSGIKSLGNAKNPLKP